MKWIELSVEAHPDAVDAIANIFQERVPSGIAIEQPVKEHIEGEEPVSFSGNPRIRAYIPLNGHAEALEQDLQHALWHLQAFDLAPIGPLSRREIVEEDWAHGWKQHFHPLRIGRFIIKPTWREWNTEDGQVIIELDPGMAFGTGLHPTTKLMLEALPDYVKPGMRVLDLGTGSGILAIGAAKLGARVRAIDISDVAAEVAENNCSQNEVQHRVDISIGTIQTSQDGNFDLILANIIASILSESAAEMFAALKPDGILLASGIIEDRRQMVEDAFGACGFSLIERRHDQDWWMIVAQRPL